MDAGERLEAAQVALRDGRHAEALVGLEWFHAHALAESDSWYGVRLSFALASWTELAQIYAPAMAALLSTRERTLASLLRGESGRNSFHDVQSIDEYLKQVDQTYQAYLQIEKQQPDTALTCGRLALDAILQAGDFERAARIAPSPEPSIRAACRSLHCDLICAKAQKFSRAPTRWVHIGIYLDLIEQTLAIVNGLGQRARAPVLAQLAIDLVQSPSVRRDVKAGLVRQARAPDPERKRFRLRALRAPSCNRAPAAAAHAARRLNGFTK